MNTEKLQKYLIPIVLLIVTVGIIALLVPKISENINSYKDLNSGIEGLKTQVTDKTNTLNEMQKKLDDALEKEREIEQGAKPFYKPIEAGLDTEAVIAGEFAEILELIRANKIKVRTIKYDYNPADDEFVKNGPEKYNCARLNMEMITSYSDFDNFLKELYKHKHFLDIQSFEIVPYKKNRKILLINFKLKLYSRK